MKLEKLKERFFRNHGDNWEMIQRTPMFMDWIELLRAHDPARYTPSVDANSATENAETLLGRISGFNLAINLADGGIERPAPDVTFEPTYQEEATPTE